MTRLPPTDVVIVGLGWTGSIQALDRIDAQFGNVGGRHERLLADGLEGAFQTLDTPGAVPAVSVALDQIDPGLGPV